MTHSDDDGLIVPPRLAATHAVILPIYRTDEERATVLEYCATLKKELSAQLYDGLPLSIQIDDRDIRGGEKAWQHIKKGVPLRLEIGPRDVASGSVFMGRRDREAKDKQGVPRGELVQSITAILDDMQSGLYTRALKVREDNTRNIDSLDEFVQYFTPANEAKPEIHGGFALAHVAPSEAVLEKLKELKVTARCIPLDAPEENGKCIFTGAPSKKRMVFAKSY